MPNRCIDNNDNVIYTADCYTYLTEQNTNIDQQLTNLDNTKTGYQQKTYFTTMAMMVAQNIFFILLISYFLLLLISIFYLFVNKNITIYSKIFIIVFFAIYPFFLYSIEIYIFNAAYYLYCLFSGTVYIKPSIQQSWDAYIQFPTNWTTLETK
jgi:hypothetical protein